MKNCCSCKWFKLDYKRSFKLGELLGICRETCDGNYIFADFEATDCEDFKECYDTFQQKLAERVLKETKQ